MILRSRRKCTQKGSGKCWKPLSLFSVHLGDCRVPTQWHSCYFGRFNRFLFTYLLHEVFFFRASEALCDKVIWWLNWWLTDCVIVSNGLKLCMKVQHEYGSTNQAQRELTSLVWPTTLPTNSNHHHVIILRHYKSIINIANNRDLADNQDTVEVDCCYADVPEQSFEADNSLQLWAYFHKQCKCHNCWRLPYCCVWGLSTEVRQLSAFHCVVSSSIPLLL